MPIGRLGRSPNSRRGSRSTPPATMRAGQARYVTACQQLLALGVVLVALTPAASVVSLDVVASPSTAHRAASGPAVSLAAYTDARRKPAVVDTGPVEPAVREISLTPAPGAAADRRSTPQARLGRDAAGKETLVSTPQDVVGYGAVGVTWDPSGAGLPLGFSARSKKGGSWSKWSRVVYDADHGPDPDSAEARRARPGTDALLVGRVDKVQIRAKGSRLPADLRLAVIDPGADQATARERADIDTGQLAGGADGRPARAAAAAALIAPTPAPTIYSRAQWGADDSRRSASTPSYFEVHAGFVHHTVTGNDYTEADVPGIIRSIYAYHTRSRGWSDIGYNFLVDKFGRIWEGRYGGVDRAVVGAHTLGYNEYSFAMSAIGNYETTEPSAATLQAYGALFAWKLSLHGVSAASTSQVVGKSTFQAVNGHRDAGQTACPGKYLYAQLPLIRQYAASAQVGWAGRQKQANLLGDANPDLVARRKSDGQLFIIPTSGTAAPVGAAVDTGRNLAGAKSLLNVGDWDRDGFGDIVTRQPDGALYLYRGDGAGHFVEPVAIGAGFNAVRLLAAVGDVTGDGLPDIMGQPRGGSMMLWPGAGMSGLYPGYGAYGKIRGGRHVGFGLMDGDGAPDSLIKKGKNLKLIRGNGPGGLSGKKIQVKRGMKRFDWMIGVGDLDLNGSADLVLRNKKKGTLWAMSAANGTLSGRVKIGSGMEVYDLAD